MKAIILGNVNLGYSWFVLNTFSGLRLNGYDVIGIDYKSTPLNEIKQKILNYSPNLIFTHLSFHANIHPTDKILQFFRDIKNKIDVSGDKSFLYKPDSGLILKLLENVYQKKIKHIFYDIFHDFCFAKKHSIMV